MKFDSIETKKMDRETTVQAIEYLTKRINFNNELNKHVRAFMRKADPDGTFNGYRDTATREMIEDLIAFVKPQDWMDESDKKEYYTYATEIYGQVYGPHVNQYVRERLKRCEQHLKEIDASAQNRKEEYEDFTVTRDLGSNRLNIKFDGIPDFETRSALKRNGFKWSPYLEVWTRQLTTNAEKSLEKFLTEVGLK